MEENKEIIEKILSISTKRQAPRDLSKDVFTAWKAESVSSLVVKPLIPKWMWFVLSGLLMGIVYYALGVDNRVGVGSPFSERWTQISQMFSFEISASPVVLSAVVVMVIMLGFNVLYHSRAFSYRRLSVF